MTELKKFRVASFSGLKYEAILSNAGYILANYHRRPTDIIIAVFCDNSPMAALFYRGTYIEAFAKDNSYENGRGAEVWQAFKERYGHSPTEELFRHFFKSLAGDRCGSTPMSDRMVAFIERINSRHGIIKEYWRGSYRADMYGYIKIIPEKLINFSPALNCEWDDST